MNWKLHYLDLGVKRLDLLFKFRFKIKYTIKFYPETIQNAICVISPLRKRTYLLGDSNVDTRVIFERKNVFL